MTSTLPPLAEVIALLEAHGPPPESRPEATTEDLVERHPELAGVAIEELAIDGPHGGVPARLYTGPRQSGAALVWLHGGAFIAGTLAMPEAHWVGLALAAAGIPVLSADYRKALHGVRFPVPLDDVVAAWEWADASLTDLVGPTGGLHLGGASAGGNLAAGATVRSRDHGGPLPSGLVLVYPVLHGELPPLTPEARAAIDHAPDDTVQFTPDTCRQIGLNYVGDAALLTHPHAFPAAAGPAGLPPTLIVNAQYDTLRASGEAFGAQLSRAGVDVRVELEPGAAHGFLDTPLEPFGPRAVERIAAWITRR
jgi:acetyl esterase